MIGGHAALARVMEKAAQLRALVQRQDRIGGQRPITHCRDVQQAGRIGPIPRADLNPHFGHGQLFFRRQRMVQPFVLLLIDVIHCAEGPFIQVLLGALIDNGPFVARKRRAVLVALKEILAQFGADLFEKKT